LPGGPGVATLARHTQHPGQATRCSYAPRRSLR
jgi:hypothetical protein